MKSVECVPKIHPIFYQSDLFGYRSSVQKVNYKKKSVTL